MRKFQYKVWRTPGNQTQGAFRARVSETGGVLGVEWTAERENELESMFAQWAADDRGRGLETHTQAPTPKMPKTPRP